MNKERKIETLAEIDGYDKNREMGLFDEQIPTRPPYLDPQDGHGHLQRILCSEKMDEDKLIIYSRELCALMIKPGEEKSFSTPMEAIELLLRALTATVVQKADTIIKAFGKWED